MLQPVRQGVSKASSAEVVIMILTNEKFPFRKIGNTDSTLFTVSHSTSYDLLCSLSAIYDVVESKCFLV